MRSPNTPQILSRATSVALLSNQASGTPVLRPEPGGVKTIRNGDESFLKKTCTLFAPLLNLSLSFPLSPPDTMLLPASILFRSRVRHDRAADDDDASHGNGRDSEKIAQPIF
ncbi:MAG: hypothetical protein LBC18_04560 [Opitutaceae bacterium]|nr:hypothetical protein [Opitutaceae bacterium]